MKQQNKKKTFLEKYYDIIIVLIIYWFSYFVSGIELALICSLLSIIAIGIWRNK